MYLHIREYSKSGKHLPIPVPGERVFTYLDSVYYGRIDNNEHRVQISEYYDTVYDSAKLDEEVIPLDDVVIYDNLDIVSDTQPLSYVYRCPVCLRTILTTESNLDFCPNCENTKFAPEVVGLLNKDLMDDIAIDDADETTYIQVKDDSIILRDERKKVSNERL